MGLLWLEQESLCFPTVSKEYVQPPFFFFCCNHILFAICTSTFSKLCKQRIKQHVEGRSVALLCK
jgi:hypothetical protein